MLLYIIGYFKMSKIFQSCSIAPEKFARPQFVEDDSWKLKRKVRCGGAEKIYSYPPLSAHFSALNFSPFLPQEEAALLTSRRRKEVGCLLLFAAKDINFLLSIIASSGIRRKEKQIFFLWICNRFRPGSISSRSFSFYWTDVSVLIVAPVTDQGVSFTFSFHLLIEAFETLLSACVTYCKTYCWNSHTDKFGRINI